MEVVSLILLLRYHPNLVPVCNILKSVSFNSNQSINTSQQNGLYTHEAAHVSHHININDCVCIVTISDNSSVHMLHCAFLVLISLHTIPFFKMFFIILYVNIIVNQLYLLMLIRHIQYLYSKDSCLSNMYVCHLIFKKYLFSNKHSTILYKRSMKFGCNFWHL